MTYTFSKRSLAQLDGIHPALLLLAHKTLEVSPHDFGILQGLRTLEEQKKNVANGVSQTMNSRHLTGHAIDFGVYVAGKYINGDTPAEYRLYEDVAQAFKDTAKKHNIAIIWGGDWKTLKDGGHIELDRKAYP